MMRRMQQQRWLAPALILLLAVPLLFSFLGGWSFLDPDEGRYGTIPYQMLTRADFITPTQNEIKFFDKPPLLYWLIAASYSIFGTHEWAARLIPALAALLGVITVYALGQRMFSLRAGVLAALILTTSLMWLVLGRFVVTDMLVSSLVFMVLALWWFGHADSSGPGTGKQTAYFLGFWIVLALAVLAKGPIAVVLTGGCLFSYMVLCRQWGSPALMRWGIGIPLFLAITVPWFVLVAQRNPEFNHFFWYDQHIGRFLGKTTNNGHVEGIGYYFKFLPLVFFPWSFFVPAAALAFWSQRHRLRQLAGRKSSLRMRAITFLLCGAAFTLSFFSTSSGKLLTYILPMLPLMALLLAAYFDWLFGQGAIWNRALSIGTALLAAVLLTVGLAAIVILPAKLSSIGIESLPATLLGGSFMLWGIALITMSWRFRLAGVIGATTGGFAAVMITTFVILTTILPDFTTKTLAEYIQPGIASHPDSEVLTLGYIRSIPFYTGKRVEILGAPGELEYGVLHMPPDERRLWVFEDEAILKDLQEEMHDPYPVYCFIEKSKNKRKKTEDLMRKIGHGATPIIANKEFLVFGNRAAAAATPPVPATLTRQIVGEKTITNPKN